MKGMKRDFRVGIACLTVALLMAAPFSSAEVPDWSAPCEVMSITLTAPQSSEFGFRIDSGVLTLPKASASCNKDAPVVVLHHGFLLNSGMYTQYAQLLASFGFAVLEYNLPIVQALVTPVDFELEAKALPKVITWAKSELHGSGSSGYMEPNWSELIASGHSRGGWIAFLQLADNLVKTSAMLDAVSGSGSTFPTPQREYWFLDGMRPSWCAPTDRSMEANTQPRPDAPLFSRLKLPRAGHMQFVDTGRFAGFWNRFCGRGRILNRSVRHHASTLLAGYLLEGGYSSLDVPEATLVEFRAYRKKLIADGVLEDLTQADTQEDTQAQPGVQTPSPAAEANVEL